MVSEQQTSLLSFVKSPLVGTHFSNTNNLLHGNLDCIVLFSNLGEFILDVLMEKGTFPYICLADICDNDLFSY
jgi:hypothetical protein